MDLKIFNSALAQIVEEKAIPPEKVLEVAEAAISAAYKKEYGQKGQIIKAEFDPKSGDMRFWQVKTVVTEDMCYTESELLALQEKHDGQIPVEHAGEGEENKKIVFNPERHILLDEARKGNPDLNVGDEIKISLPSKIEFGRIASQTAKQVLLQKIKEVERDSVMSRFKTREGEIVSGVVQRVESRAIYLDVGKAFAVLPKEEQVPGEFYRPEQRFRVYVLSVEDSPKGPTIFVSRIHPKLLSKLFELEVPEIPGGQIKIMSIAREAGYRSKIAVQTLAEGVDPIGAMVGQRGTRIAAVINELGGEKIDIIEWSEDPEKYIANSLSPAKVLEVKIMPKNTAQAIVPKDQLSLAIGKGGQNVRLAAKLTGWKIDIKVRDEEGNEEEVLAMDDEGNVDSKIDLESETMVMGDEEVKE